MRVLVVMVELKNFKAIVDGVNSNDTKLNLRAIVQLRKYLLSDRGDPISKVVRAGVVPRFVEFLGTEAPRQLQFEATQVLTIIAAGTSEQTKAVVEHGAVPRIVGLLASDDDEVHEQAILALKTIASQTPRFRDVVLEEGAMGQLLEHFVMYDASLSMLRHVAGPISSFCGAVPRPVFEQPSLILDTLARLLDARDEEVLQDTCWALSYLSDGKSEKVKYVIAAGVCGKLVDLIQQPVTAIMFPALLTLCHIAAGGSEEQIRVLASHGCVQPLCALLGYDDDVSMVTLEVINNLLKVSAPMVMPNTSAATSILAEVIARAGGFGKLLRLKLHDNKDIREKAEQILEQHYWPSEELMLQVVER